MWQRQGERSRNFSRGYFCIDNQVVDEKNKKKNFENESDIVGSHDECRLSILQIHGSQVTMQEALGQMRTACSTKRRH
jgi:hypothetical protein